MALHRFSRTELLIGAAGLERLRSSHVVVCGIGGVGSYATEALGRAGVGTITLVDFDDICLTNCNRQIHATSSSVGRSKVAVMAERLRDINPQATVLERHEFFSQATAESILSCKPDYVLDAIDHFTAKAALIIYCREAGIPVISSMGAANKLDPAQIKVADIADTSKCRMARSMRKILRQAGIVSGVPVVYSTEEHRPLDPASSSACGSECICPNRGSQQFSCEHRRVILGSISYLPPLFGLTMAGVVINNLLEFQHR